MLHKPWRLVTERWTDKVNPVCSQLTSLSGGFSFTGRPQKLQCRGVQNLVKLYSEYQDKLIPTIVSNVLLSPHHNDQSKGVDQITNEHEACRK